MSGELVDDGAPYAGSGPSQPDTKGAPRVINPVVTGGMRPGVAPRLIDKQETTRLGTSGRAFIGVDRPVEPTALPYDPTRFAGAVPTRLDYDPRREVGSGGIDTMPGYVILSRLKATGAEEWMLHWVWVRGQRGQLVPDDVIFQLQVLTKFGDAVALRMLRYIDQVHRAIYQAANAQRQSQAARMGIQRRG